ncbi:ADP-ribosylglycohydrolase family protein [Gordonia sp. (in: high G+C Gram-positive bacteria)]|uniref:ADP-ribosylglycohydrolase family protein n=1 Tax=Gordonia sp. (in: high G+C Gram-positive bacteria) TaxID=84139 RepID=UPI0016AC61AB|nr:ADP-ribosylglycohydrolase family protein [Gordonia sp. (in: high G+C Gram-positive bacteria)]NLG47914.1 ADP-ribosylglycohydrolase family protein [Gordonia sp. (in: high G+C Gram-positive bacteria)]
MTGSALSPAQLDRARGTLVGAAVGDALGVPYEFAARLSSTAVPEMLGGGLGDFAPGEWSDDTSMLMAIALAGAAHRELLSAAALDAVATGFLDWYSSNPPDIGIQTRGVLSDTQRAVSATESVAATMTAASRQVLVHRPNAAGNGALMRTAPVALAHLDDRSALADAARAVAALTHAHADAVESCVLWCESIRVAILTGELRLDSGLDLLAADRRDWWDERLREAADQDPRTFERNGYTVYSWQAAASSAAHAQASGADRYRDAVFTAIRIGDDTDTTAAITGALMGAVCGLDAIDEQWQRNVHGWPRRDGQASTVDDLIAAADAAVRHRG